MKNCPWCGKAPPKGPNKSIKELREERGWSRNELARRAQMAASDIGKIEAGRIRPYESQLRKIEAAFRGDEQ